MTSIRRQLLVWLVLGFSLATIAAAIGVYRQARLEAGEILDFQLQQMAAAFPKEGFGPLTMPPVAAIEPGDVVVVQIWDQGGVQVYLSRPDSPPPESHGMGFSTVSTPDGDWRVYSAIVGNNVIQVSQPTSVREELAAAMALRTMLPLLVLMPLLILLIWITVGRGLKPLNVVASAVGMRSAEALQPLPEHGLPTEVKPLVSALNELLARLGRSLSFQRSFIADAAHELRTPLAAVQLQIQVAERTRTDDERAAAFAQLKGGVDRATRLVGQLLALARYEPEAAEQPFAPVNLTDIARDVVVERAPIADAKEIDLGLSSVAPTQIMGDAEALRVMLGNLVDNAIHYTPTRGTVDLEVRTQSNVSCLVVTDTGPGIPPAERERVFDRFYRGDTAGQTGSGLGLAIVRRVAQRHRASIELGEGSGGRGLKVTVCFPENPLAKA
jgi:two-component system OmpR family sensor kinase